jgi:hypothetical protein
VEPYSYNTIWRGDPRSQGKGFGWGIPLHDPAALEAKMKPKHKFAPEAGPESPKSLDLPKKMTISREEAFREKKRFLERRSVSL